MDDLITIVTLTYRKFDHLFETIDSVLRQDYKNIEYIISDDGSPEFPEKEILKYLDERAQCKFKVIHHEKNVGTVKNLNFACKNAHGTIIMPLSCGDVFYDKNTVSQIVERMKQTHCKLLVTSRLVYQGKKEPLYYLPYRKLLPKITSWNKEKQYEALLTSKYWDMASGSAIYYTKEILEELHYFDEKYILWEDGPFLKKYLNKYELMFAYDIISIWYESGGVSSAKRKNILMSDDIEKFAESICKEEINNDNPKIRNWANYLNKRKNTKNKIGLIITKLLYPHIFIETLVYKIERKVYRSKEIRQLKNHISK